MFYTYLWLREYDGTFPAGTPYYAGKGKGERGYQHFEWERIQAPENPACILIQEFPDEDSALEGEKMLIAYFGRIDLGTGCLYNLTDGGEGLNNPSEETLNRMSASWTSERRAIHSARMSGKNNPMFGKATSGSGWEAANRFWKENPEARIENSRNASLTSWDSLTGAERDARLQPAREARWATGVTRTWKDESRKRLSASVSGENNPFFGKKHTLETIAKANAARAAARTRKEIANGAA